jgi:hypothetical protein
MVLKCHAVIADYLFFVPEKVQTILFGRQKTNRRQTSGNRNPQQTNNNFIQTNKQTNNNFI